MAKKKKKEFRFFWEEPVEKTKGKIEEVFEPFKLEPFEFKFTIPRVPSVTEMRLAKSIPINISSTEKELIVKAELPGFKKNEINLNVTESFVEILASKKQEKIEKTEKTFRQELSSGILKRTFSLPEKVDPDNTKASLEDGLLTIILPKTRPQKKKRKKVEII